MVANCLFIIYQVLSNLVYWLMHTYLTDNVSIGGIIIVISLFALVINSFVATGDQN